MSESKPLGRTLKRARTNAPTSVFPCIPESIRALRLKHNAQYVKEVIRFLRSNVSRCHPESDVGWWCRYGEQMKHLVTFLSDSEYNHPKFWAEFRSEVSNQLSLCRQCGVSYHKAVNKWELSDEVTNWSVGVARKRICELVDWDAHRLIPALEKGIISARLSDDPSTLAHRTQCREAFLESLLSLRLCMREKFCAAVGKVFRTRSPAKIEIEVTNIAKTFGAIPPGIAALCFHSSVQVRKWAKSAFESCRKLFAVDEQVLQLLISKGLRLVINKATGTEQGGQLKSSAWAPHLQSLWDGLSIMLESIPSNELETMMKRRKKFPIVEAACVSLRNAGADPFSDAGQSLPAVLSSLRLVIASVPFTSLFTSGELRPGELLEVMFECLRVRLQSSPEIRPLLDMMLTITSSAMRESNVGDASALLSDFFRMLEDLEASLTNVSYLAHEPSAKGSTNIRAIRSDILSTGAGLLRRSYWHSFPKLRMNESMRISSFVLQLVRGLPERDCSWDVLRKMLLADVFNLIRAIYEPREAEMITRTFFSIQTERTLDERSSVFQAAIHASLSSHGTLSWMSDLWANLKMGSHLSDENKPSEKIRGFEINLGSDLHRLVGVLDPHRCGDLGKKCNSEPSSSHMSATWGARTTSQVISQRIETVQDAVVTLMRVNQRSPETCISFKVLPFHAAHLLSSRKKEVARHAHLMLQRRYSAMQNGKFASPLSQDRVLVQLLEGDKDDCRMIIEGFKSAARIKFAQGATISLRAYPSFFRWYSLLVSKECRVLRSVETTKGVVGVLLSFLEDWRMFESQTNPDMFCEALCRLFSVVPDILTALSDETEKTESTSERIREPCYQSMRWCMRKVAAILFDMDQLRDEIPRKAWLNMITNDKLVRTIKGIDSPRAILMNIVTKHEQRDGPLGYVQCRKLIDAFDLEEAVPILNRWAQRDARKVASRATKVGTSKAYRETKIDNFFSSKPAQSGPLFFPKEGRPLLGQRESLYENQPQRRTNLFQKRQMVPTSVPTKRANGALNDLRKDHRQSRAELRKTTPRGNSAFGGRERVKTRFELLREEKIAEKERKKTQTAGERAFLPSPLSNSEDPATNDCSDRAQNVVSNGTLHSRYAGVRDVETKAFEFPSVRRELQTRCLDQIKRDVLISHNGDIRSSIGPDEPPGSFFDVESYVSYWEPLVVAEFRASIRKRVDEERFFAQNNQSQKSNGCHKIFEVDDPAEDIGYLHTLSVTSRQRDRGSGDGSSTGENTSLDTSGIQISDLVMLDIFDAKTPEHERAHQQSQVVVAIVSNVQRAKKELQLTLQVVFDNTSAPGKGRRLRVSKLLSFTTFQRQLEALWAIPKMQDGILWSLLDPAEGWSKKQDLDALNKISIDSDSSLPSQLIQKLENQQVLNASQSDAIREVIRNCSCLFARRGEGPGSRYAKESHGGVSLIQGPPGTGKTSTIVALLSALSAGLGSRPYSRRAKVIVDGRSQILSIPTIRVLVCAPSNAAVDELMLRVMNDGLFTLSGNRVCPRIVRVGRGTTIDALKALEIRSLSKSERAEVSQKGTSLLTENADHNKLLVEVNKQIGELDNERKKRAGQSGTEPSGKGKLDGASSSNVIKLRQIDERLDILHDKKKFLYSAVRQERNSERKADASRRQEDMRIISNILATASVVFATLSSSGHDDMKTLSASFDVVIIDEAGQSCEPDALIPITLNQKKGSLRHRFLHCVLVGDPKQLPATVISNNQLVKTALGRSLFERVGLADSSIVHLLDTQYRMHPKISSYPSARFYGGLLRNSASVKRKDMHMIWHFDKQRRFGPLTMFNTAKATKRESRSRCGSLSNESEAKLIVAGLMSMVHLYGVENLAKRVAVLSPYKEQVLLLKQLVSSKPKLLQAKVEVSTIDGIQGREKSIVLLSTVRSGHSSDIGFVKDDRRLNVALSRAKHTLMIFGHAEFLSTHSDSWAALVTHCKKRSRVISLTSSQQAVFPESRRGFRPKPAQEPFLVDLLSDIEDDMDSNIYQISDQVERGGIPPRNESEQDLEEKGPAATDTRQQHRLGPPLSEVNCSSVRTHHSGKRYWKESKPWQSSPHRPENVVNIKEEARDVNFKRGESQQKNDASNSNFLVPKRVLEQPQLSRRFLVVEQQGVKDGIRDLKATASNPVEKRQRTPTDMLRTNSGATMKTLSMNSTGNTKTSSAQARKISRPPCLSNSSRSASHYSTRPTFHEERKDRAAKRTTETYHVSQKQESVPLASRKRRFYSMTRSDSHRQPPPPNKKLRQAWDWGHDAERRHARLGAPRYSSEKEADKHFTHHRNRHSHVASGQHRSQAGQRLVRQHQSRIQKPESKHPEPANIRQRQQCQRKVNRVGHSFSLADTQTKLKGTLDAAREARRNGTHQR